MLSSGAITQKSWTHTKQQKQNVVAQKVAQKQRRSSGARLGACLAHVGSSKQSLPSSSALPSALPSALSWAMRAQAVWWEHSAQASSRQPLTGE